MAIRKSIAIQLISSVTASSAKLTKETTFTSYSVKS